MSRLIPIFLLLTVVSHSFAADPAHHGHGEVPVSVPRPEYPYQARFNHLTGAGVFALHIQSNGSVSSVQVVKSTGHLILDQAAIRAFRRWRFMPGARRIFTTPVTYTRSGAIL